MICQNLVYWLVCHSSTCCHVWCGNCLCRFWLGLILLCSFLIWFGNFGSLDGDQVQNSSLHGVWQLCLYCGYADTYEDLMELQRSLKVPWLVVWFTCLALIVKYVGKDWIDKVLPPIVVGPIIIVVVEQHSNAVNDATTLNKNYKYLITLLISMVTLFAVILFNMWQEDCRCH